MARHPPFRVFGSLRDGHAQCEQTVRTRDASTYAFGYRSRRRPALPPLEWCTGGYGALHWPLPLGPLAIPSLESGIVTLTNDATQQVECVHTSLFFCKFRMGDAQCSVTCGGGVQTRKAHCVDLNGRVIHDSNCPPEEKILRQSCHMESCPRWEVGEWTPVNQSLYQIKCSF